MDHGVDRPAFAACGRELQAGQEFRRASLREHRIGLFLALAPGWLNLGLWEGPGSEDEAEDGCRRLVRTLAMALPGDCVILDVANGLSTQDPLIAEAICPRRLVAVNITEWQLLAGLDRLREAGAAPVAGDATRLPIAAGTVDGVISVEAPSKWTNDPYPHRLAVARKPSSVRRQRHGR